MQLPPCHCQLQLLVRPVLHFVRQNFNATAFRYGSLAHLSVDLFSNQAHTLTNRHYHGTCPVGLVFSVLLLTSVLQHWVTGHGSVHERRCRA